MQKHLYMNMYDIFINIGKGNIFRETLRSAETHFISITSVQTYTEFNFKQTTVLNANIYESKIQILLLQCVQPNLTKTT